MRYIVLDNVKYDLQWSSRMTKTPAKLHETQDRVVVRLSSVLVTSQDQVKQEIYNLMSSPNVLTTDSGRILIRGRKLGQGGFARVYECSNNLVVKSGVNLSNEMTIHRLLSGSQYVPTFYDRIGMKSIIMERFEHTLKSKIPSSDYNYMCEVAKSIIDCLKYIHSRGIVHCDLKPSNIFISTIGRVVLGDFGLARTYSPNSRYLSDSRLKRFGTMPYMSRDVHNRIRPTRRSDMESFAWVVVEMFGGVLPWRNDPRDIVPVKKRGVTNIDVFLRECFENKHPPPECVKRYLELALNLSYNEVPDYDEMKRSFDGWIKNLR